jgi:hypothetical protein
MQFRMVIEVRRKETSFSVIFEIEVLKIDRHNSAAAEEPPMRFQPYAISSVRPS